MEPGNPSYNIPSAVRLTGSLNYAALEASLNEIVRRHESLRTTIVTEAGQPRQLIASELAITLSIEDLSQYDMQEGELKARQCVAAEAAQSFDLAQGPLFRVRLLKLDEQTHIVLFTMHHIISDEWSLGVLVQELAALYTAFCDSQPSPLPEPQLHYADVASGQSQQLHGAALEKLLSYWRQQLRDPLPVLDLPFDRPRPERSTYEGALYNFNLTEDVSNGLRVLSRQESVTLFMTMLAALQTLLHRYTGQTDIVVGTDISGRNRLETEGLIGFFVNHLVLRTSLSDRLTFRALLKRVREVALGAYAHQDMPFDRLVSALQPDRKATHMPLFQVLFVFGHQRESTVAVPGLTLHSLDTDFTLSKYDLTLFITAETDEIRGAWRYRTELFEPDTINHMATQFTTLLSSIVANPDNRLKRLEMFTEAEKAQTATTRRIHRSRKTRRRSEARRKAITVLEKS